MHESEITGISMPGSKKFIPGIAWFFIVLILVCTPGPDLPEVGDWFGKLSADKFIHTGIFGLLAFLFMYPVGRTALNKSMKKNWFLKISLSVCVWGIVTELLQLFFIPGRSFSLMDIAADCVGSFIAFGASYYQFLKWGETQIFQIDFWRAKQWQCLFQPFLPLTFAYMKNVENMEYNTTRNHLIMKEYGRHIQKMVEHVLTIEDKDERQKNAYAVIELMGFLNPHLKM